MINRWSGWLGEGGGGESVRANNPIMRGYLPPGISKYICIWCRLCNSSYYENVHIPSCIYCSFSISTWTNVKYHKKFSFDLQIPTQTPMHRCASETPAQILLINSIQLCVYIIHLCICTRMNECMCVSMYVSASEF